MISLIYSIIPTLCFIAGIYIGFGIRKDNDIPTPRKAIRKYRKQKREDKIEKQNQEEEDSLRELLREIDEY